MERMMGKMREWGGGVTVGPALGSSKMSKAVYLRCEHTLLAKNILNRPFITKVNI